MTKLTLIADVRVSVFKKGSFGACLMSEPAPGCRLYKGDERCRRYPCHG